jgi:cation diffusion facilitator CzcD-associated flavoprotein CzcO
MTDINDQTEAAVCVVGAGLAGLAIARALKAKTAPFDVYERNSGVGGIWRQEFTGSPIYDSALFISSKVGRNRVSRSVIRF